MRKVVGIVLGGLLLSSCVTTTKVYRDPNYKMNRRDSVFVERTPHSFIYSDAQLISEGNIVKAEPDKKVDPLYGIDSLLVNELKQLKYKAVIVDKGWANPKKGLVISYKDYWVNEADPAFFRFWLKGMSLRDSSISMVYEGAPIPSSDKKPSPVQEVKTAVLELLTPGIEQEPDDNDYFVKGQDMLLPKSKFYLSLCYGVGQRFGNSYNNVLDVEKKHKESLNKGAALSADLAYFIWPSYGVGITYSSFTSDRKNATIVSADPTSTARYLSDKVSILYYGPAFFARNLMLKGRLSSVVSFSGGMIKYEDSQIAYTNDKFESGVANTISGSGVGAKLGLSLEFLATKNVGVGLNGGLALGRTTVKDNLAPLDEQTQKIWLNHFTVGVGLRFYY